MKEDYPQERINIKYVRRSARRLNRLLKLWCRENSENTDAVWHELFDLSQLLDEFEEITRKDDRTKEV